MAATTTVAPDLEHLDAPGVLEFMVERFHPRLAVACSFQKEASVVLDLILKIVPDARIFTLDTHVLFPETYETWRKVEERYGISVEVHQGPRLRVDRVHALHAPRRQPRGSLGGNGQGRMRPARLSSMHGRADGGRRRP